MSDWDTMLANDALPQIKALGATLHTYTPKGQSARSIYVLVERNPPAPVPNSPAVVPAIDLYLCATNDTDGVVSVTKGADTIAVKGRQSDATAQTYTIAEIVSQDPGLWHLRIYVNG